MKKIFVLMMLLVFVSVSWGAKEVTLRKNTTYDYSQKPGDCKTIYLHTRSTGEAKDTLATTKMNIYGPYSLTSVNGGPMYKGFYFYCGALTGTSPVSLAKYQLTGGATLADTAGGAWTEIDSIPAEGSGTYVDLTSKAGTYIWFNMENYDGSSTHYLYDVYAIFKENFTFQLKK